jgi:hypothetical protein
MGGADQSERRNGGVTFQFFKQNGAHCCAPFLFSMSTSVGYFDTSASAKPATFL